MRAIDSSLTERLKRHVDGENVRRADALRVSSYRELVEEVARLAYLNKDHVLFYRGQVRDFRNRGGASTVYPSIYRGERVTKDQIDLNFSLLDRSAQRLCKLLEEHEITGFSEVQRKDRIQWSILQHYEVCSTPLLDLTQSLLVATSFAYHSAGNGEPYVMVFGLPYVTHRISRDSEQDIINIRLLGTCPPEALRPHFQEGYLAGTDDVLREFPRKGDLDFGRRLLAKFRLGLGENFWKGGFSPLREEVLYPEEDAFTGLCEQLREEVAEERGPGEVEVGVGTGKVGEFLRYWTPLERHLIERARWMTGPRRIQSVASALRLLRSKGEIPGPLAERLSWLRKLRNELVHRPEGVDSWQVDEAVKSLRELVGDLVEDRRWRHR